MVRLAERFERTFYEFVPVAAVSADVVTDGRFSDLPFSLATLAKRMLRELARANAMKRMTPYRQVIPCAPRLAYLAPAIVFSLAFVRRSLAGMSDGLRHFRHGSAPCRFRGLDHAPLAWKRMKQAVLRLRFPFGATPPKGDDSPGPTFPSRDRSTSTIRNRLAVYCDEDVGVYGA